MFIPKLLSILERERISQRQLAKLMRVNESEISKLLSGVRTPTYNHVVKISNALNIYPAELFEKQVKEISIDLPKGIILQLNVKP